MQDERMPAESMPGESAGAWLWRNKAFLAVHLLCLGALWHPPALWVLGLGALSHYARAFGLTGGYHRLFSHRTYKTSRWLRFVIALLGALAAQRGPLWWAGHHVTHHRHADTPQDVHSPVVFSVWWSHLGWHLSNKYLATNEKAMKEFLACPELVFLDRHYRLLFALFLALLYATGALLDSVAPSAPSAHSGGSTGWQLFFWVGILPTVTLYHATFCVNSLCHLRGYRRFETPDHSRNNALVALLTMGEGWHNNHHRFPAAARQGLAWYELDATFAILWCLEKLGLVHDLRRHPAAAGAG